MLAQIGPAGSLGLIADERPWELPPEAWTEVQNMRCRDGSMERVAGFVQSYGTPSIAPYFNLYVPGAQAFWLYAGLAKVYGTDGTSHTDLTRNTGGDYHATADLNWTGGVLGGLAILNNGVDAPQFWASASLGTKLADLTNWPASTKCGALRPFKSFLVALDVTESGTRYPQMVRWSHPADPGTVPVSWDYTDPSVDAGRTVLAETKDACVDCVPLGDVNIIYKEQSTWIMQFIGGTQIFKIGKKFDSIGAMSRRCAIEFFAGKHIVRTIDDIVVHDGQQAQSLLTGRLRRTLNNDLDSAMYQRSFVAVNWPDSEVWFPYVVRGETFCTKALVWNFKEDRFGFRDMPKVSHVDSGLISNAQGTPTTWDADTGTWNSDNRPWDIATLVPTKRQLLAASPPNTKLYAMPQGTAAGTGVYGATLERQSLYLQEANQPAPRQMVRQTRHIYPYISGPAGATVLVYVGGQEDIEQTITYKGPFPYVIGQTSCIDATVRGRLHSFKFVTQENFDWRFTGYDVDFVYRGHKP